MKQKSGTVRQALPFFLMVFAACLAASDLESQSVDIPIGNRQQIAWQKAELGVLISYDLHVFDSSKYNQAVNRITPIADYNIFNPEKLDVEQWIRAAKDAGARFAILTATHETGFALYQSDVNPYCMKALKWKEGKGDLVRDFVQACRKYGLQPGIFLGIRWNSFLGVHDFKVDGTGQMQKRRQAYYNKMVQGMVKEICTRYGPLFEIWFDGGASSPSLGGPDVLPIVKKYQPNCLFYHNNQLAEARWGGSETGTVEYPCWSTFPYNFTGSGETTIPEISKDGFALLKHGDPQGKYWVPAMADAPLRGFNGRHEWFWEPGDEEHIYPLKDLLSMYYQSVGRNATLILGLTPDNTGLLPLPDVERLREFGREIKRRFGQPLGSSHGSGKQLVISFSSPQRIDQIVIQEDISKGQRIKHFIVEALVNGKWRKVEEGSSVGNKFIGLLNPFVTTKKLRLKIDDAFADPIITNFSVYNLDALNKDSR